VSAIAPRWRTTAFAFLPHLIAIIVFATGFSRFYDHREGFTALIGFGSRFEARNVPAIASLPRHIYRRSSGYDGQFYAQIATDPLLKDPATDRAMDNMPLRARRILFAWTAWLAGAGRPWWILQAYALQNVACWIVLSVILLRWFVPGSARMTALWIATLFSAGLLWSVRFALLDGPSLLLIALAMAALERGRSSVATVILSVAALGRETNLLAASILAPTDRSWAAIAQAAARGVLVLAPLALWFDYIYSLYRDQIYTSGSTISVPFAGLAWKLDLVWTRIAVVGVSGLGSLSVLTLVSLAVQAAYVLARMEWGNPWWRLGVSYVGLLPFLGRPLWEGETATALRVMVPLALVFNVLLRDCAEPRRFWSLLVAGNLTVLSSLMMLRAFGH
jgi:hypothetical protein